MTITFFDHQNKSFMEVEASWNKGNRNVLLVIPTGGGKTLVKAEMARRELYNQFARYAGENKSGYTIVFAHRDVLLSQISAAMCMLKIKHSFIAAKHTVRDITNINLSEYGDSFYDETSKVIVASVDSFKAKMRKGQIDHLVKYVTLWQLDEAHHLLNDNKWGDCVNQLVNAYGLGVTATPLRADGKGLGRGQPTGKYDTDGKPILDNDGVFDDMVVAVGMGELIKLGRLSAYKIYVPPSKLDTTGLATTSSGDYNQAELAKRTDNADITGDAVEHYLRIANGLQAITYCVNIAHSEHVAEQFNRAGVPSKALSSKTPIKERQQAIKDFKAGRIKNLVNSDLFGEGFDVPALVVGIMLRKTDSYSLFKQQFGRPLRTLDGKEFGIIIDHVNNVRDMMMKYGLSQPHDDPEWTLDRQSKRKNTSNEPVGRVCPECAALYMPNSTRYECPYCHHEETEEEKLAAQQEFQHAQGNLVELNVNFINELMQKRQQIWQPVENVRYNFNHHTPPVVVNSAANNHLKRQYAHTVLVDLIQRWCADMAVVNQWDITTVQNEFHLEFGINIFKAQTLSEREALELSNKIKEEYN